MENGYTFMDQLLKFLFKILIVVLIWRKFLLFDQVLLSKLDLPFKQTWKYSHCYKLQSQPLLILAGMVTEAENANWNLYCNSALTLT